MQGSPPCQADSKIDIFRRFSNICAGLVLIGAAVGCRTEPLPKAARPDPPRARVVTLIATAEVKGTTEPCGCTSDPLGDVARVAKLAEGGLWIDAGSLLGDEVEARGGAKGQARRKGEALAAIVGAAKAAVGLGPGDLVLPGGAKEVAPPRLAVNVPPSAGVPLQAPEVRDVDGVKIGLFGVVAPERVKELAGVGDPVAAAREAVAALRAKGAQVVVAVLGMSRREALPLVESVEGIDVGVVGAEVGEGMIEAQEAVRASGKPSGWIVAPADQGRRVARVDLHVVDGKPAMRMFGGEVARHRDLQRTETRRRQLALQLEEWRHDPTADPAFLKAREAELVELKQREAQLASEHPTPPAGSYFTYALEPIRRTLPRAPSVAEALRALDRRIGKENLEEAQKVPPPTAEADRPRYVGVAACGKCHKAAVAQWKTTVHAHAWKTLVDVDKQYNYDCTGCHVTGFLKPGGSHLASVEAKGLVDVQCETCHGPGSTHVAEAGLEEPRTMVRKPAPSLCADNCHTKDHSDTFQLEPYLRDLLGPGHGEKRRAELGAGVTAKELRARAVQDAKTAQH